MSYDLLLERKRTVPVKVPITIHKWLEGIAKRKNRSVPSLVLSWILEKYDADGIRSTGIKNVFGKSAPEHTAKDKKGVEDTRPGESSGEIQVFDENAILEVLRKVGLQRFPEKIKRIAFVKLLVKAGMDERTAENAVNILVMNQIYSEDKDVLILRGD